MTGRFNLLVDPRFEPLKDSLRARIRGAANAIDAGNFAQVLDPAMRHVVRNGFAAAGAHEGSVWIADPSGERLVIAYNTGPDAAKLVGHYQSVFGGVDGDGKLRPPGIVSSVFQRETPFCENRVYQNGKQDPTLDRKLGVVTCSMMVVPFSFAHEKRGAVSCVQLKRAGEPADPPGFPMESLTELQRTAELVSLLIDHWLVGVTTGWIEE